MNRKKIYLSFIVLFMFFALSACAKEEESQQNLENDGKIQIGFTFDSMVIERWQRDRDIFVSRAKELGAQVNIQNAGGEVAKQKEQMEYFIRQGVDVIVVVAIDTNSLSEQVKAAKEKGIKVIAYDRMLENADVDLYASFDSVQVGRLFGEAVNREFPKGAQILEIMGSPQDHNVVQLELGLQEILKDTQHKVVQKEYAQGWVAEHAFDVVSDFLERGKKCDVIICGNDDLATQAIRALSEGRKAGKVYVLGQDGDLAACQRIVEKTQGGTVFKNIDELAARTAEEAVRLAKGETGEAGREISDGTYSVPYLCLDPVFVDRDNIDEVIIEGGFHSREEVYLNAE